jgi:hypothetical protein
MIVDWREEFYHDLKSNSVDSDSGVCEPQGVQYGVCLAQLNRKKNMHPVTLGRFLIRESIRARSDRQGCEVVHER